MFKQVHHVGYAVWELDKVISLMEKAFGLKACRRAEIKGRKMEAVLYEAGDSFLEYLAPTSKDSPLYQFLKKNGEGFHHIAYLVDSIEQAREILPQGALQESRKSDVGDWTIADFKDINGSGFINQIVEKV